MSKAHEDWDKTNSFKNSVFWNDLESIKFNVELFKQYDFSINNIIYREDSEEFRKALAWEMLKSEKK